MLPVNYMQVEGEDGPVLQLLYVSKAKKYSKLCNTAMCSVPSSREEVGAIFFFMNTSLGKQTSRQIWITWSELAQANGVSSGWIEIIEILHKTAPDR